MAPLLLAAWIGQGCFVLEEIDKGQAIMDQHSPNRRPAAEEPAEAPPRRGKRGADEEGVLASVQGWWKQLNEPKPAQRDPNDVPVRCALDGSVQFVRSSDCALRGGRVL
jgi:hypothetical protein